MARGCGAIGRAECRVRILSASHGDLLPLMARVLLSLGDGGPEPCGRQTGYEKTKLRHPASSSRSARADLPAAIRNVPVTPRFLRRGHVMNDNVLYHSLPGLATSWVGREPAHAK